MIGIERQCNAIGMPNTQTHTHQPIDIHHVVKIIGQSINFFFRMNIYIVGASESTQTMATQIRSKPRSRWTLSIDAELNDFNNNNGFFSLFKLQLKHTFEHSCACKHYCANALLSIVMDEKKKKKKSMKEKKHTNV